MHSNDEEEQIRRKGFHSRARRYRKAISFISNEESQTGTCRYLTCQGRTTGGKRFCKDHVLLNLPLSFLESLD